MRKIRAGGSPGRSFLILAGPDAAVCTTATLEHGLSHGTQGSVRLRAPRSGAQTVMVPRVCGGVRKPLLLHRGNGAVHRTCCTQVRHHSHWGADTHALSS